jgi:ABC-type amino acid transport substrate-binding protein
MRQSRSLLLYLTICICSCAVLQLASIASASAADLQEIKKAGVLRHLGVPYANFVTGSGDGLDVEVVKLFAQHLGVEYEYVETLWKNVIADVSGARVSPKGKHVEILGECPVKGDIVASGLTILPWREKVVNYSIPVFPTQVWVITQADSPIRPIRPNGDINKDIAAVRAQLRGRTILGMANTCLDPSLYGLGETGAQVRLFHGNLNELAPAIINRDAETTLLDVPDALIALKKWPGKIKVIGPVSPMQNMGYAFAKRSSKLRHSFNNFFRACLKNGTYLRLVKKYYTGVLSYYPEFFAQM